MRCFIEAPRPGEVYNCGGGRANSISILESFQLVERLTGKPMRSEYTGQSRKGDHICYISNLAKMKRHYPQWSITRDLTQIFSEICASWQQRLGLPAHASSTRSH
jgi:CDP-paratose 2-epimerase